VWRLLAVNVLGAVLFAGLYALGGTAALSPRMLLALVPATLMAMTALWVWAEGRAPEVEPVRRLGRGLLALTLTVVGLPAAVLMPLFGLERELPAEAASGLHIAPTMVLLLVSLVLVGLVNAAGGVIVLTRTLTRRRGP
jgi:hypothetical protein